jgi:KDO2-lipid IV(A) lauroyltransferase
MTHSGLGPPLIQKKDNLALRNLTYRFQTGLVIGLLWVLHRLDYPTRLRFGGWFFSRVVVRVTQYQRRILQNLALIFPDLTSTEAKKLSQHISQNIGITFTELFSPKDFVQKNTNYNLTGNGFEALKTAQTKGRPAIVVSGHFGNYDVVRTNLIREGLNVGGLYRRMENPYFHDLYIKSISAIGDGLFERGLPGLKGMLKFLRGGGVLAVLIDQRISGGETLNFMGHPAYTSLSIAELALKLEAVVVPAYAVRKPDLSYDIVIEDPIVPSTARQMTQDLNDSLSKQVRAHPEQWFWIHRRWLHASPTKE